MSVKFVTGDIFNSSMQTLVNPVNCFGIMGRGIALKFKNRYPEMFDDYVIKCNSGVIQIGKPDIYKKAVPWVINFPTKNHWRDPSRFRYVKSGLDYLVDHYKEWGVESIATPALGCGLGGLEWNGVKVIIEEYLEKLEIPVEIYEPVVGFKPKK
jgi:O-acetyl-ADP-ribose deacetylase (regulator of RNase III)